MKILLITAGSRGDVEPFVSFARRAISAGHVVRLAIPDRSGADASGIDTVSLGADYSSLIEVQGVSAFAALRSFTKVVRPIMQAVIANSVRITLDFEPDIVVYHPKVLSAPMVADRLGIPHVVVELVPAVTPTSAFPAPGTVAANLGPLNRLTYSAASASARMFSTELSQARALVGATSRRDSPPALSLMPISPQILARPADWPGTVKLTGAWFGDAAPKKSDAEWESFAAAGECVYAGFGSMATSDPIARGRAIVVAARAQELRLVVATGLGGIAIPHELEGEDVLIRESVDHGTVLARAIAAIHHGGIGTVHAAARAGTVSIVVPFIADQPFWGAQLHRKGLAPAPIPSRALSASKLARALAEAPDYGDEISRVARAMADEDGLTIALDAVERARL